MILSLFAKNSRFTDLLGKLKRSSALGLTLIALSLSNVISAQTTTHDHSAHQHEQEKQAVAPPKQKPIFI